MKNLKELVIKNEALILPAKQENIDALQQELGFLLSDDYCEYLSEFGVISHGAFETYGLGVKDSSHLHALNIYKDLSADKSYPSNTVPILEVGDGQYYLYDNITEKVLLWATPNGGVVSTIEQSLESFITTKIFR